MQTDESIFFVREVTRVRERYEEIDEYLSIVAPQALLRDLHRPISKFTVGALDFERHEIPRDAGRDAIAAMRSVVRADYRVPITELVPTHRLAQEGYAELRRVMSLPWQDAPKLKPEYLPAWRAAAAW